MVFADSQWLPEYLSECYPVFEYVVLEQVRPPCRARQPSAYRQAGFRLGKMGHELVRRQRRRHRLNPDSRIHRREHSTAAEMRREARLRVAFHRNYFSLERTHQDLFARDPVECEPARVAPLQLCGKPFS